MSIKITITCDSPLSLKPPANEPQCLTLMGEHPFVYTGATVAPTDSVGLALHKLKEECTTNGWLFNDDEAICSACAAYWKKSTGQNN